MQRLAAGALALPYAGDEQCHAKAEFMVARGGGGWYSF